MTPLKGANGQVYAMAQGNLLVGGAGAQAGGSSVQVNQLNGGIISNGAIVERSVPTIYARDGIINLELNNTDLGTAQTVVAALNRQFGPQAAVALDGRVIQVRGPIDPTAQTAFLSRGENTQDKLPPAPAQGGVNQHTRSGGPTSR